MSGVIPTVGLEIAGVNSGPELILGIVPISEGLTSGDGSAPLLGLVEGSSLSVGVSLDPDDGLETDDGLASELTILEGETGTKGIILGVPNNVGLTSIVGTPSADWLTSGEILPSGELEGIISGLGTADGRATALGLRSGGKTEDEKLGRGNTVDPAPTVSDGEITAAGDGLTFNEGVCSGDSLPFGDADTAADESKEGLNTKEGVEKADGLSNVITLTIGDGLNSKTGLLATDGTTSGLGSELDAGRALTSTEGFGDDVSPAEGSTDTDPLIAASTDGLTAGDPSTPGDCSTDNDGVIKADATIDGLTLGTEATLALAEGRIDGSSGLI